VSTAVRNVCRPAASGIETGTFATLITFGAPASVRSMMSRPATSSSTAEATAVITDGSDVIATSTAGAIWSGVTYVAAASVLSSFVVASEAGASVMHPQPTPLGCCYPLRNSARPGRKT